MRPTHKFLVIIPARNEEDTIGRVVAETLSTIDCKVLVVDDRSSDATAIKAGEAGAITLSLALHLGAWGAIQTGMRYALRHGYETVITMDGDGQHKAAVLPQLMEPINNKKADVTIGSCIERGSTNRKITWIFFRKLTGLKIDDLTSGLRVYNLPAIRLLASSDATLLDYQDLGVLLLLRKNGLKIMEVETEMIPRISGHSRIFSSWWVVFLYLLESVVLSLSKTK